MQLLLVRIDLGESMAQAGVRETKEETGTDCEIVNVIGGEPTPSSESTTVRWVARDVLDSLPMDRSMRRRIHHYLEPGATLYFDWPPANGESRSTVLGRRRDIHPGPSSHRSTALRPAAPD